MIGGFLQCKNFEQMSCDEATPKEARLSIPIRLSANGFRKEKKNQFKIKTIALCVLIHRTFFLDYPEFFCTLLNSYISLTL